MFLDNGTSSIQNDFSDTAVSASVQKQIVIFTSGSFVAHQHLNHLLPFLAEQNIKPVIFLTSSCKAPRANIVPLQQYAFYEGDIFNEVIYPTVEAENLHRDGLTLTFNQMVQKYEANYQKIEHHTNPAVKRALEIPGVIGSLSIYQDEIFKSDFIELLKVKAFLEFASGSFAGKSRSYIAFWSLLKAQTDHGYTLHEIDSGIDTGRIINTFESNLDPNKPIVQSYIEFAKGGSNILKAAITDYVRKGSVNYKDVRPVEPKYYTFPAEEDISEGWNKNVRLWGTVEEMISFYQNYFGNNEVLNRNMRTAISQVEGGERVFPAPDYFIKKKSAAAVMRAPA